MNPEIAAVYPQLKKYLTRGTMAKIAKKHNVEAHCVSNIAKGRFLNIDIYADLVAEARKYKAYIEEVKTFKL